MKGIFKQIKVLLTKLTGPLVKQEETRLLMYKTHQLYIYIKAQIWQHDHCLFYNIPCCWQKENVISRWWINKKSCHLWSWISFPKNEIWCVL